ncbi:MAG: MBOAT family O-acyltransferase [Steroidobacteraceae bacterium]
MVFDSLTFVVFFACVLGLHSLPLSWQAKKINLLIVSYFFYAAWYPPFVVLLWVSTLVDWYAAQGLVKAQRPTTRHAWMLLSVILNLGMLGYFKYGQFLLDNFGALCAALGIAYHPAHHGIWLPIGISFYTFATMSYTLDVYLRRAAPAQSLLDYALFVTFFPHLVAGPIMRPTELVPQFAKPRQATREQLRFGLALMTLGLFNKIVLADSFLSGAVDRVYDGDKIPGALDAWAATLAFSGQIFCDFAGYSTTAIGTALCLGFFLPDNFRFPYAAVGFADFWRRWHITLSSWLRDYIFIPLGGNRRRAGRPYYALFVTMLLAGLWHGASWTFVAFGGLHGLYLASERALRMRFRNYQPGPVVFVLFGLLTYVLVVISMALFRARGFSKAWLLLRGMFGQNAVTAPILSTFNLISVGAIVSGIVLTHWAMRSFTLESIVARTPAAAIGVLWALMAFAIVIAQGGGSAFIYFQF